jgi:hypothetical protein
MKTRYRQIDAWRGYPIPGSAVVGASYTGEAPDSPATSSRIKPELAAFRAYLRRFGIKSRLRSGPSSNLFCQKIWVCVPTKDFKAAASCALEYIKNNARSLSHLHDAGQEGVAP